MPEVDHSDAFPDGRKYPMRIRSMVGLIPLFAVEKQAEQWLAPLKEHLSEAGLGHISEIFDGDAPHRAVGCIAEAWSVAEIFRAAVENVYGIRPQESRAPRDTVAQQRSEIKRKRAAG